MLPKPRAAEIVIGLIFAKRNRIVVQLPIVFAKRQTPLPESGKLIFNADNLDGSHSEQSILQTLIVASTIGCA
jgi:hypothetical protein